MPPTLCNTKGALRASVGQYRSKDGTLKEAISRRAGTNSCEQVRSGSDKEWDRLLFNRPLELFFDTGDFAPEAVRMALSVVDFDRARNTVAIFFHPLITLLDHREDLFPLPL